MLNREQIEAALRGEAASPGLSIREALETALALMDENERLKGNIDGWKAVMKKTIGMDAADVIKKLEAENARLREENESLKEMVCSPIDFNHWKKDIEVKSESLMKQYVDATYRVKELEAENARLRRETQSYKNLIARYEDVVDAAKEYVNKADKETENGGHQYTEDFYEELKAALAALKEEK